MKTVTKAYKHSMAQDFRNRSHCIITFGNTDISAITDGNWVSSASPISSYETLDYKHNFNNTIATLELNRWSLDGTCSVKRENDGWISNSMSIASIRKEFDNFHSLNGITLTFDTREEEWPFAVTLNYFAGEAGQAIVTYTGNPIVNESDNELYTEGASASATTTVYPTGKTCQISLTGTNVKVIEIYIHSMLPYRRARIERVDWGVAEVFDDSKILSATQTHDVDPLSRRLPSESLTFQIEDFKHDYDPDNPGGIYAYLTKGAPVSISYGYELEDGTTEWLKDDKYSLSDIPTFKDNKVTFKTVGLINSMTGYYYKDVYNSAGKTLYSLAESVLLDANLPLTPDGNHPWDLDSSLNTIKTTAVLPVDLHANLLQLIAHAAGCKLSTDDSNIIHIHPFGVTPAGIFKGTYSDSGHTDYSEWNTVDSGNNYGQTVATLELNRWVLDGTNTITRLSGGYVSNALSTQDGSNTSYWEKEFDVIHDLQVMNLTFDSVGGTYPYKVLVEYFGDTLSSNLVNENDEALITDLGQEIGASLLVTNTVYPTSPTVTINTYDARNIKRIKVTAYSLLPQTRSRVSKVSFRESDFSLTLHDIKHKTFGVSKLENLRNLYVTEYKYTASSDETVLFEGDTDKTSVHIEYSASTNINVTVTGGTVTSQSIYAQACDINMSSGTKHILVKGRTIESQEQVHAKAVNNTGADDSETNPLITSKAMADSLSDHVQQYLTLRNTYDADYRGNPELEVGDIIELQTQYTNVVYGLILTDEISYNGALHGKVKVKGLV